VYILQTNPVVVIVLTLNIGVPFDELSIRERKTLGGAVNGFSKVTVNSSAPAIVILSILPTSILLGNSDKSAFI
jgi:hypothetical protein